MDAYHSPSIRIEVRIKPDLLKLLNKSAEIKSMSLGTFIKVACLQYLKGDNCLTDIEQVWVDETSSNMEDRLFEYVRDSNCKKAYMPENMLRQLTQDTIMLKSHPESLGFIVKKWVIQKKLAEKHGFKHVVRIYNDRIEECIPIIKMLENKTKGLKENEK